MSTASKCREVAERYGYDSTKGKQWRKKVRGMSDQQITAIWLKIQEGKKKDWRTEYPIYLPDKPGGGV